MENDKELRQKISTEWNGSYAIVICRCGNYAISPDGNTKDCPIVNACPKCSCKEWTQIIDTLHLFCRRKIL